MNKHPPSANGNGQTLTESKNFATQQSRLSRELEMRLNAMNETGERVGEICDWLCDVLDEVIGPAMPAFSRQLIPNARQLSRAQIIDAVGDAQECSLVVRSRLHTLINQRIAEHSERDSRELKRREPEILVELNKQLAAKETVIDASRQKAAATMRKKTWLAGTR